VVLPDGREVLALDGPWGVALLDGATSTLLSLPGENKELLPVAVAADQRPCREGFVPALAVAWRLPDGSSPAVSVHPLADAACRPVTPSAETALVAQDFELEGLSGLGLSPNGRQLLAVVDQGVARRVVSLEIGRGTDGVPRSLSVARIGELGVAGLFFDPEPQPGRVAFSSDGSTAWTVLPGPGAMISIE